jgi:hypothetical protein
MLFTGGEVRIGTIVSEVFVDCVWTTMLGPCEQAFKYILIKYIVQRVSLETLK